MTMKAGTSKGQPQKGKGLAFTQMSRLARARAKEYTLQSLFKYGYRNKEDISNLPASTLVVGSQNVLTNAAELVGIREGYALDGPAGNQNNYGIDSSYDFLQRTGTLQSLRKWGTTLEVRYVNPATNAVSWVTLLSTLSATNVVNFTNFWDLNTEVKMFCLFVNGDNNVREWSGGVGSFASATANTITLSGSLTTDQLGFYSNAANSAKFQVLINGTTYTYTGVSSQTLTGVTPDPSAAGITVGAAVMQATAATVGTGISANGGNLGAAFVFDIISTLENQIWYGSFNKTTLYVSKTNNYKDVSYSTPARLPAEGALITLDSYPVGYYPQSGEMYITAGRDQWWISQKDKQTIDVAGIATPTETLYASRLKTARNQAAQSQGLIGQFKNSLVFVSNEQIINAIGLVKDIQTDPQVTNMSDPIKYDVEAYNFTGGQVLYDNYFIYVTAPVMGIVRMYNVVKQYWEAPQVLPVSRFYRITGSTSIYGHSSLTNESYQMFTGYNDNGNPINAIAAFPYTCVQGGAPNEKKSFNKLYTEGYISSNTTLTATINYDFGGFSGTYTAQISGNQGGPGKKTIFNKVTDGSLGQNTLGSEPIGTILNLSANNPKFRIVNTMPRLNVYEYQIVYQTNDIDQQWTLLRFGPAIASAPDMDVEISI